MVSMFLFCRMILSKKSATFWDHALIRTLGRARIGRAERFEGADCTEASGGAIVVCGQHGLFAFNIDQTRDAIGGRVERREIDEQTIALDALIG